MDTRTRNPHNPAYKPQRDLQGLYAKKALKADLLEYYWLTRGDATRSKIWSHMNRVATR